MNWRSRGASVRSLLCVHYRTLSVFPYICVSPSPRVRKCECVSVGVHESM